MSFVQPFFFDTFSYTSADPINTLQLQTKTTAQATTWLQATTEGAVTLNTHYTPVSTHHNLQQAFALNYDHIPWSRIGRENVSEDAREGRSKHPKATAVTQDSKNSNLTNETLKIIICKPIPLLRKRNYKPELSATYN